MFSILDLYITVWWLPYFLTRHALLTSIISRHELSDSENGFDKYRIFLCLFYHSFSQHSLAAPNVKILWAVSFNKQSFCMLGTITSSKKTVSIVFWSICFTLLVDLVISKWNNRLLAFADHALMNQCNVVVKGMDCGAIVPEFKSCLCYWLLAWS